MHTRLLTIGLAAAAVLAAGWLAPVQARPPQGKPVVSHVRILLSGTVTITKAEDACLSVSQDMLDFSKSDGEAVVVAVDKAHGGFIHVNIADASVTGTSGNSYILTGADKLSSDFSFLTGGKGSVTLTRDFNLVHTDGCASTQVPVKLTLQFVDEKLVESGSTAVVGP